MFIYNNITKLTLCRITYNNYAPKFVYNEKEQKLDTNSLEGAVMQAYIGE